jgi:DNA-binding transcriptional LysR family regulator
VNTNNIDLNLLPVFQAIYSTRSVTLAGDELSMTQSAVSNALKRMRARFNDSIFVRTPEGMVPTPLAERLIVPVREGLAQLDRAIDQGDTFDPKTSNRLFRLAVNDIGQLVLFPRLVAEARRRAPDVRFETVDASRSDARQGLMQGSIDVAVGSSEPLGQAFYIQSLFDETFVVVMDPKNCLVSKANFEIADYTAMEHIAYRPSGTTDAALQSSLRRAGVFEQRRVVVTAASSTALVALVANSDLLLTVPKRLAAAMLGINPLLVMRPVPFPSSPFEIRQQWHERFHHECGNRWLRELIFSQFHDPTRTGSAHWTQVADQVGAHAQASARMVPELEIPT